MGLVGGVFNNGLGDRGIISCPVIQKNQKMVLTIFFY